MPQNIEKMYPYDIVVTAFETELPRLTEIAKQYHANVQQYPMVRMTSIYGSEKLSSWNGRRPIQWPQGQQIAISESTYQQMREFMGKEPKNLHLKGERCMWYISRIFPQGLILSSMIRQGQRNIFDSASLWNTMIQRISERFSLIGISLAKKGTA